MTQTRGKHKRLIGMEHKHQYFYKQNLNNSQIILFETIFVRILNSKN